MTTDEAAISKEIERLQRDIDNKREIARQATSEWYYYGGSEQAMSDADDEVSKAEDAFYDFTHDHDLCDACGKRNPTMLAWPFRNCPDHTDDYSLAVEIVEHDFDLLVWCDTVGEATDQPWVVETLGLVERLRQEPWAKEDA